MSRGRSIRRRRLTVVHLNPLGTAMTTCCNVPVADLPTTCKCTLYADQVTCPEQPKETAKNEDHR